MTGLNKYNAKAYMVGLNIRMSLIKLTEDLFRHILLLIIIIYFSL